MRATELNAAYVLHTRSFRETSCLIELFTLDHGRITVLAKGMKKAKHKWLGILQPFVPLLVSWTGKSDLKVLVQAEMKTAHSALKGSNLFAGFYLNELLMILLQSWDTHTDIFALYEQTLNLLKHHELHEAFLRIFEKRLVTLLGYMPDIYDEWQLNQTYHFLSEQGFVLCDENSNDSFSGKTLAAIYQEDFEQTDILREAKRLMRLILLPLLGNKSIYSRQLFS